MPVPSGDYPISRSLPKQIFIKDYPVSPRNFGQKLRKVRMDAGLKIKELARMLGVTEDTVINWEVRGVTPKAWTLETIEAVVARLETCKNQDRSLLNFRAHRQYKTQI